MGLNPTSGSSTSEFNWNYSKPDEPGFSTELIGTVVAMQETQAMNFGPGGKPTTPAFWDDGNPKMNIRLVLCGPNGGFRLWTFSPASKAAKEGKKKSVHLDLFKLTADEGHPDGTDMMNLIGQTIKVETDQPPAGFSYGIGNPRPWRVSLVKGVKYELNAPLDPIYSVPKLLANSAVSGGQFTTSGAPAEQADQGGVYDEDIPF